MADPDAIAPESTAVRVALWRALHVQVDSPPHLLDDEIGLQLVAPQDRWRRRGDMDPRRTSGARGTVVARARFIEDLVAEQAGRGVRQYVILGAGLDTFAQRRPDLAAELHVYEVDQPGPQEWKRRRLLELGFGIPEWLRLVPVDFEASGSWWDTLIDAGFDAAEPAVVASTWVAMYLSPDAVAATLHRGATLAAGSTFAMTFQLPLDLLLPEDRPLRAASEKGARAAGTPLVSFFTPHEMVTLAHRAGFRTVRHVPAAELAERYFADRTDGLRPSSAEDLLLAGT